MERTLISQGKPTKLGIINESLDADRRCCFNKSNNHFDLAIYELISVQNDKKKSKPFLAN